MALIKSNQANGTTEQAVVLDLGNLSEHARLMRSEASRQAEGVLAEARKQADAIRAEAAEQGRREGFAKGVQEGKAAGHAEALQKSGQMLQQLQQAWVRAAQQWDSERHRMVMEARHSLLQLAVAIAVKIVRRVPTLDPSIVADQVAEAITHVTQPHDVRVRIHPQDRKLVDEALPGIVRQLSESAHVALHEDANVPAGGCIVSSGNGRIDATIDTQLQRIVDLLLPLPGSDTAQPQEPNS